MSSAFALMRKSYQTMGDALRATHRDIFYSLCQYGVDSVWDWGKIVGAQMWRTTDDINDSYGRMILIGTEQADLPKYAGPGHWNDPDMLEIGNGHMTVEEYRTHMSLWVLLAAPLLAGNDLSKMTDADKSLLMNRDAISIDQDKLGKQAVRFYQNGDLSVWLKPLSGGRTAVGLFNNGGDFRDVGFDLKKAGFPSGAAVHDVWKGTDEPNHQGLYSQNVPGHGSALLILSPKQ